MIWLVEAETLDELVEGHFTIIGGQKPCSSCQEFDCYGCKFHEVTE